MSSTLRAADRASRHQPGAAQYRFSGAAAGARGARGSTERQDRRQRRRTSPAAPVLAAHAAIAPLGWLVFVEVPARRRSPRSMRRSAPRAGAARRPRAGGARQPVSRPQAWSTPIRALRGRRGAHRRGRARSPHRHPTGDELQALGEQFNSMAAQLQELVRHARAQGRGAHASTGARQSRQVALPRRGKPRSAPAAACAEPVCRHSCAPEATGASGARLVAQIDAAVAAMNELFDALLDISKLDAGVLAPNIGVVSDGAAAAADRRRRSLDAGAREGTDVACGAERRLGAQRLHPARTHPAQPRVQRGALHGAWRHRGRLPAARRSASHRGDDSGIGIPADQQSGDLRRVLPGRPGRTAQRRRLGPRPGDRRPALPPARASDRGEFDGSGKGSRFAVTVPLACPARDAARPLLSATGDRRSGARQARRRDRRRPTGARWHARLAAGLGLHVVAAHRQARRWPALPISADSPISLFPTTICRKATPASR